jgi:hypothetical protein
MKALSIVSYVLIAMIAQSSLSMFTSRAALADIAVKKMKACKKGEYWGRCENPKDGRPYVGCCPEQQ